jgi:zinc transporter ZupT
LILFVEKIAFDSHTLIDHGDGHGHSNAEGILNLHGQDDKVNSKGLKENLIVDNKEPDSDLDLEEETIKNVISSRGKFASFLQLRNSMIDNKKNQDHNAPVQKQDKALLKASIILKKTLNRSFKEKEDDDLQYMVNPKNVDERDNPQLIFNENPIEFKPISNLTPFLLLVALSLHGFFEGLALGIQGSARDTIFLFVAIISHKWAEAFTLVTK